MTPTQEELETSILLMLGEEARASSRRLSAAHIARKFIPPVGETQIKISLAHLKNQGLVSSNFDNPKSLGYQVTRDGLLTIEGKFDRVEEGENSSYRPKAESSFSAGELEDLAAQGTYVFPVPPEGASAIRDSVPAPIIIHNHVNPVFNNTNASTSVPSPNDLDASRAARSGTRAGWANVWIALIVGVAGLLVALWIAGKIHF